MPPPPATPHAVLLPGDDHAPTWTPPPSLPLTWLDAAGDRLPLQRNISPSKTGAGRRRRDAPSPTPRLRLPPHFYLALHCALVHSSVWTAQRADHPGCLPHTRPPSPCHHMRGFCGRAFLAAGTAAASNPSARTQLHYWPRLGASALGRPWTHSSGYRFILLTQLLLHLCQAYYRYYRAVRTAPCSAAVTSAVGSLRVLAALIPNLPLQVW